MAYQVIYRMTAVNFEGQPVTVHVSDTTSGVGTPTYTDLQLLKLSIKTVNDTERKEGIRGKKAVFAFQSTSSYSLNTFLSGNDNRYEVEVLIGTTSIFIGSLVTDATKEAFLPFGLFGVELTATDKLGLLRDIPLTEPDGSVPQNENKIIQYISWCLQQTGLQLPIKIIYNLFPEGYTGTSNHTFNFVYLDAKTFETIVGQCENCYQVLEKILKGCILVQENGAWWILRTDEMDPNPYRYFSYTYDGTFTGTNSVSLTKTIGRTNNIKLINKDAEISPERKYKYVKQTFQLETWREIFCNIDFERGTFLSPIVVPGGAAYSVECWTNGRNITGTPAAVQSTAYIKRLITNTYETERVAVLPSTAAAPHYLLASALPVNLADKFRISVDRRFTANISGSSGTYRDTVIAVKLVGSDSSTWWLTNQPLTGERPGDWILNTFKSIQYVWDVSQEDETDWHSVTCDANATPIDGYIYVYLVQTGLYNTITNTELQNLQFDYRPNLVGTYNKLNGQYHKVSSSDTLRANLEEQVYISDSPSKLFKGTMMVHNGTDYIRTTRWYDYNYGTGGKLGLDKWGKYMAFAEWNQRNRVIRKLQGSLVGLDTSTPSNIPGLLHKYSFAASTDHTTNKTYMLLSYSQDLISCKWDGIFSEVYDTDEPPVYDSTHEFKYVEANG